MKTYRRLAPLLPFALLLALPACQRPEEIPKPADLLPREKMVPLLADLHQLEAQVENSRLAPDSARALFLMQQKNLLWKREVSDSALQHSYRYYGTHAKDLPEIYQAVIDTLKDRQYKLGPMPAGASPMPPH